MIAYGIALLVVSLGAILAGGGYVRTAARMTGYGTTRGRVLTRDIVPTGGETRSYRPKVTYRYAVEGVEHTSDKITYAIRGVAMDKARRQLDAIPDDVDVHYDPLNPGEAYLEKHTPRLGYWIVALGIVLGLLGFLLLFAAILG
jgi:uncharacterized protein DUF3592